MAAAMTFAHLIRTSLAAGVERLLSLPLHLLRSQRDAPNPPFLTLLFLTFLSAYGASGAWGYAALFSSFRDRAHADLRHYYELFYLSQFFFPLIPAFYATRYKSAVGTLGKTSSRPIIAFLVAAPLLLWNLATAARHCGLMSGYAQHPEDLSFLYKQIWTAVVPYPVLSVVLLYSLLSIGVAPLIEELFFRGFFLNQAYRRFPLPVAILLTSAGFALFHPSAYRSGQLLFTYFINAVFFALLRVTSGSIYPPIICHVLLNILVISPKWLLAFHYHSR